MSKYFVFIGAISLFFFAQICFSQSLPWFSQTQTQEPQIGFSVFTPAIPERTIQRSSERTFPGKDIMDKYEYFSDLSQEEIIAFYRNSLLSQGFRQTRDQSLVRRNNVLVVMRGYLTNVTVVAHNRNPEYFEEGGGKTPYTVIVQELRDVLPIGGNTFIRAKRREDIAVYPEAKQFFDTTQETGSNTSYLTKDEVQKVIAYYKDHMGQFGWRLEQEFPAKGRYNLHEVMIRGTAEPQMYASYGVTMDDLYPGIEVTIEGSTLVYDKDKTKCYVIINELKDSPEQLLRMRIDPAPFQKYGRVWIAVVMQTPEQNSTWQKLFPEATKQIIDILGLEQNEQ